MGEDEKKVIYLQMIQSTIDRMSTSSAIFKGFSAAIITGISAISFEKINKWVLLLSIFPVICFLLLDVYYLKLERRFRILYEMVIEGKCEVDFRMIPPRANQLKNSNITFIKCIKSTSILLFYIPLIVICVVLMIIKFINVL